MRVFKHRRDANYLTVLRERLSINGPNGLLARAVKVSQPIDLGGNVYDRCCRIDFAGISASNLFDSGRNFVESSVADCIDALFASAQTLNDNGVFVKLRFLLVYPYSAYAVSRMQAEASRNRASMQEPQYRRDLHLIESVDEQTFQQSHFVRTQVAMLQQLQEWVDKNGWTPTTLNRAIVRFSPISPNLCVLIVNDTVFADAYLFAKRNRRTTRCEALAPIVEIQQSDDPDTFDAFADHFRYLWDLDVTMDCEDATHYQRNDAGSLNHVRDPELISFEAKAAKLRNKVSGVTEDELWRWRFQVSRILRRYCMSPAPTPSAESLFITCSWKRGNDQRSVPNDSAREISRMIEEDFGRGRPDKLLSVHIMEGVAGEFFSHQLYSRLEEATLGLVLLTSDIFDDQKRGYCKPNVYHELGYLMRHLGPERLMIVREDDTELPSNVHDIIRIEFPKGKIILAYREIVDWLVKRCSFHPKVTLKSMENLKRNLKHSIKSGRISKEEALEAGSRVDGDVRPER